MISKLSWHINPIFIWASHTILFLLTFLRLPLSPSISILQHFSLNSHLACTWPSPYFADQTKRHISVHHEKITAEAISKLRACVTHEIAKQPSSELLFDRQMNSAPSFRFACSIFINPDHQWLCTGINSPFSMSEANQVSRIPDHAAKMVVAQDVFLKMSAYKPV